MSASFSSTSLSFHKSFNIYNKNENFLDRIVNFRQLLCYNCKFFDNFPLRVVHFWRFSILAGKERPMRQVFDPRKKIGLAFSTFNRKLKQIICNMLKIIFNKTCYSTKTCKFWFDNKSYLFCWNKDIKYSNKIESI